MTTVQQHNRNNGGERALGVRRYAQAGTSLIEIMVVLVILLIGVFLAIKIFPVGLGTLSTTTNRNIAVRLAQSYINDAQNNAANLPQGVLPTTVNGNSLVFNMSGDPDSLSGADVNNARFIKGEVVKIPVPLPTGGAVVSEYVLKFGPIALDSTLGDPISATTNTSYLNVVSAPLTGVTASSNSPAEFASTASPTTSTYNTPSAADAVTGTAALQGPLTFLVDNGTVGFAPVVMFAPGLSGQTVYVSYSYVSGVGAAPQTTTVMMTVNGNGSPVWQGLAAPGGGTAILTSGLVPGSVSVTVPFSRLGSGSGWSSTNPFQYKLGLANISGTNANPGVLMFNPIGATASQTTTSGQQAMTAYVDYSVLDWHIIHDDIQVPSVTTNNAGLIPVHLSLGDLKRVGDANPDNSIYNGIFDTAGDPSGSPDIELVALQTGATSDTSGNLIHGVASPAVSATSPAFYVDTDTRNGSYKTGIIYVNPNIFPAGSQVRFLYKADGDWAVAVQKAYSTYVLTANTAGTTRPIAGTGNDEIGTYGIDRSGGNARIFFSRNDLNKSVTISLQYKDSTGQLVRISPAQFTIDNASGVYSFIDLGNQVGTNGTALSATDRAGILADTGWTVNGPIHGVSVKTRVIWKNNNNTTNSWEIQDMDTYLTQSGN